MPKVTRTGPPKVGERSGLMTLTQRFAFLGVSHLKLAKVLWTRQLVGDGSILGDMADEGQDTPKGRLARGFSPGGGIKCDLRIKKVNEDGLFMLNFSQPDRETPYLSGDVLWTIYESPTGEGAHLVEHINDRAALEKRALPLTGPKPSLRRWYFFKFGHAAAMDKIMKRLAQCC